MKNKPIEIKTKLVGVTHDDPANPSLKLTERYERGAIHTFRNDRGLRSAHFGAILKTSGGCPGRIGGEVCQWSLRTLSVWR